MVLVEDCWHKPPTRVLIGLEADGGAYPGTVPEVSLIRRMSSEAIQSAIDRNELPEFDEAEQEPPETLSQKQLSKILDGRKDMLRACDPEHTGTMKFNISLDADGRVLAVRTSGTLESQDAEDTELCWVDVLNGTRFPAFSGPPIDFTWSMRF
jgi:hypothetical protein